MTRRFGGRLAVAALAATTAWVALWSWGGLVENPGRFISPALLGALLVVLVGATGRTLRWPWYAVLVAQLAVVVLWLDHRYASADAWGGWVPTSASISSVASRIHDGAVAINTFASPVSAEHTETYAYLLATSMLVVLSTDMLACGLRRVPWAGLPIIVTLTVPISVLEASLSWVVFVITGLLFMMLLATEETERVLGWGRSIAGRGERIDSLDQVVNGATVRGAAFRIGVLTAAGALVLPVFVPVAHGLLKGGNGPGDGSGEGDHVTLDNPIVDLRRDLPKRLHIPLLEARTTGDPSYLRLTVLDQFNGVEWLPSPRRLPPSNNADGTLPGAPGLSPTMPGTESTWQIRIEPAFQTSWLPTPYPVRRVDVHSGDWRYDLRTLDVANFDKVDTANFSYQTTGFTPAWTAARMQGALAPPPEISGSMTAVPGNRPAVINRIAEEVTAGATTDYDRMVKLQNWFRNTGGFSYSLEPRPGSGIDQLARFITTDKVGYCEQFAAAMAVMARTLGVPARVVVGFLGPDSKLDDGSYRYTSDDLHAWPEMYFGGSGWVKFEPTPSARTGNNPPSWTTGVTQQPTTAGPTATAEPSAAASDGPKKRADAATSSSSSTSGSQLAAWTVGVVLLLLLLLLPALVRARQRRRRLGDYRQGPRSAAAGALADGAWAELCATARDLGIALPLRGSVRDIARVLEPLAMTVRDPLQRLDDLVEFVERARYGRPFTVDPATRQLVVEAVEAWTGVLTDSVPAPRAWLARVFPRSVVEPSVQPTVVRQAELAGIGEVR